MTLETMTDNLRDGYNRLGTIQHVDQLMDERQNNVGLRGQSFYTADGQGYFVSVVKDKNVVEWAITREGNNLVRRHLNDAVNSSYDQLRQTGNYRPANSEALAAKQAQDTVVVRMDKLRLSGDNTECCYLSIRTADGFIETADGYQRPTREEKKVMDRLEYTSRYLEILNAANIGNTKIFALNPAYVRQEIETDPEHNSLWRASWLLSFNRNSYFNANVRDVDCRGGLRGVRQVVRGADAPKNRGVPSAPSETRSPTMEDVLKASLPFVATVVWSSFREEINRLYERQ